MAPTWPSIIPDGAITSAPASAWVIATEAYRSRVASLSTEPSSRSTPQCPWSVYSSRHASAISTTSSPTSSRSERSATCTTPSGESAPEPTASLTEGTPNSTTAGTPRSARARTSFRRLSWVCCTTPGIEATGSGASIPCFTNNGATRSSTESRASATSRRSAGVRRNRRGRCSGNGMHPMVLGRTSTASWLDEPPRARLSVPRNGVARDRPGSTTPAGRAAQRRGRRSCARWPRRRRAGRVPSRSRS